MNNSIIVTKINSIILFESDQLTENISFYFPKINYHELIFHLSGKASINFDNKIHECEKGTLRFLPKGVYKNYAVHRYEPTSCIDIFIDSDTPFSDEPLCLQLQNNVAIEALFKKAFSIWITKSEGYYHKCLALVYEILFELEKHEYSPESKLRLIEPAIEFINENFLKDKICIEHLAEISGISQSYLKKLFVKRFGVTPLKYVIQLKINYARNLLLSGMYTSSQVAEICGYSNLHFFSRQFKEYCGISPIEFKNQYTQK